MKLKIFTKPVKEEKEVYLRLVKRDDDVILIACNSQGEPISGGSLLKITLGGAFHRCSYVLSSLGFQLDEAGCVKDM